MSIRGEFSKFLSVWDGRGFWFLFLSGRVFFLSWLCGSQVEFPVMHSDWKLNYGRD